MLKIEGRFVDTCNIDELCAKAELGSDFATWDAGYCLGTVLLALGFTEDQLERLFSAGWGKVCDKHFGIM